MKNEILNLAKQYDVVQNIMPHVNVRTLKVCYEKQPDSAAKKLYGEELDANIEKLVRRMKAFTYFPKKKIGNKEDMKQEFRLIEDEIVKCSFIDILEQIYAAKNPTIFSPRDGKFQNPGNGHILYSYVWRIKLRVLYEDINQEKLINYCGKYIADKNYMRYLERFLNVGILEKPTQYNAELTSDKARAAILLNIYCYHILREWLCSKKNYFQNKVYLCFQKDYFYFKACNRRALVRIHKGLVNDQEQTRLRITNCSPIEDRLGEFRRNSPKVCCSSKKGIKVRGEHYEYFY